VICWDHFVLLPPRDENKSELKMNELKTAHCSIAGTTRAVGQWHACRTKKENRQRSASEMAAVARGVMRTRSAGSAVNTYTLVHRKALAKP
jgi:hypothetical protein